MNPHQFTKQHTSLLLVPILVTALVLGGYSKQAQAQTAATTTVLIQFAPEGTESDREAVLAALDGELVRWMPQIHTAEVRVPAENLTAASPAGLMATGLIHHVEQDRVVTGSLIIDEPALNNVDLSYGMSRIDAVGAWNVTIGITEVIVAVVDTGLNMEHPEFAGRYVPGYDFINDDDDPTDDHGHGTHVSGIIAAALNGVGTAGVCPNCRIMPLKALNANNAGSWSTVAQGILFAVDQGAKVVNLSLGATVSSYTLEAAIDYAAEHDVVVVAAAGNSASSTPYYPAAIDYVVAVSATDKDDLLWPLSNTGTHIDVSAPGQRIYSTYHILDNNGGYALMTGTSMAAPFVSGLAGLIFSQDPTRPASEVIDLITGNADDLGDAGRDDCFGYGRVNAHHTLVAANDGVDPGLETPPAEPTTPDEPPVVVPGGGDVETPTDPDPPAETLAALYLPVVTR